MLNDNLAYSVQFVRAKTMRMGKFGIFKPVFCGFPVRLDMYMRRFKILITIEKEPIRTYPQNRRHITAFATYFASEFLIINDPKIPPNPGARSVETIAWISGAVFLYSV